MMALKCKINYNIIESEKKACGSKNLVGFFSEIYLGKSVKDLFLS